MAKDSIGQRGRKQRLRSPEIKKMLSGEKDLSLKLRINTEESGKRSKNLEEARGCGKVAVDRRGPFPPLSLEEN